MDHQPVDDDLDPREEERTRRRDHDLDGERRALLRPGMGKVFKQILDKQAREADELPARKPKRRRV
jgi:hypothetical protein